MSVENCFCMYTCVIVTGLVANGTLLAYSIVYEKRAVACLPRVQELNPLVQVRIETEALDDLNDDFLKQFTAVCLVGAELSVELRLDALCRSFGTAFYAARSFDCNGIVFIDLGEHTFRRDARETNGILSDPCTITYPTLTEAQQVQWSSLQSARKRGPQLPQVFIKNQCAEY